MSGLPCGACRSECCGTVPVSQHRLDRIEKHLAALSDDDYGALSKQNRKTLDCAFIDTRTWTCAVYPVRPSLCQIFGLIEKAQCPQVLSPLVTIHESTARMLLKLDGDPVLLTHKYEYPKRGTKERI